MESGGGRESETETERGEGENKGFALFRKPNLSEPHSRVLFVFRVRALSAPAVQA